MNHHLVPSPKAAWILLLAFAAGCSTFFPAASTPQQSLPTPTITLIQPTSQDEPSAPAVRTLTLWVPPGMNPNDSTPAGQVLKQRLMEFEAQNLGVKIAVRVKAEEGPGSLMGSLTAASSAAPLALPSLVALPRQEMETAAIRKIIHPCTASPDEFGENQWFPYARQMALFDNSVYGYPLGGDTLVILNRSSNLDFFVTDWKTLFSFGQPLVFTAADPRAVFTMAVYSLSGGLIDEEEPGAPLSETSLKDSLELFSNGGQAGVFPYWLTQYEQADQAWQVFDERRANWLVAWFSDARMRNPENTQVFPLPANHSQAAPLATGWVWTIAEPDPQRRQLSESLARFLSESGFLNEWTPLLGLLPTRPGDLSGWDSAEQKSFILQLSTRARLFPSHNTASMIAPELQLATIQVIKFQADPAETARAVLLHLKNFR